MPLLEHLQSIAKFRSNKPWQPFFCGTMRGGASAAVLPGFPPEDQLCVVAAGPSYWSWNYYGHYWFRDLNPEHHNTAWAHRSSAWLGNKFTPLLHAQQKTVFANCIKERQHQVFRPQKNFKLQRYMERTWAALRATNVYCNLPHELELLVSSEDQSLPCNTGDDRLSQTGCYWAIKMIWSELWNMVLSECIGYKWPHWVNTACVPDPATCWSNISFLFCNS